jgi:hypothetical protein
MTRARLFASGALLLPALVLAAACSGGSSAASVAQLSATATNVSISASSAAASAQGTGAVSFAHCMRSNGVPTWPDPNSSGAFDKSKITTQQLGVSSSRLQTAQTACQHLLPPESATQQRLNAAQAVEFSQCMRSHGVPNFPDPDGTGRIPDPASFGIDQGAALFQAGNQACAQYRPPYIPSNDAYNAYAATASAS